MAVKRIGTRTLRFDNRPSVVGYASIVGKKEGEGPLAKEFDKIHDDSYLGEASFEKAESRMQQEAFERAASKSGFATGDIEVIYAGDLLNQCIATNFGLRSSGVPLVGLYGACSTFAESMMLASMTVDGGYASRAAAIASSHFATSERQYRTPMEYGSQRAPTAQWTVTGAGACVISDSGGGIRVTHATPGRIVDLGVIDQNNMGAAMAPSAHDTLTALFTDTGTTPADYDLIITGDLGAVGLELLMELFKKDGVNFAENLGDCGLLIFDRKAQDVHAGGSGCGCSASVMCAHIFDKLRAGSLKRVVFAGTGAMLSPTSTMQGESVPGVCHAVVLESDVER